MKVKKKVNYGMIGFGGIGENRIAKEGFALDKSRFKEHPDASLLGATDINPERKVAVENLGLKWYDSVEKILEDSDIDAVYIASNNLNHAPLADQCIEAGKHPFVEKPVATTLKEAYRLREKAAKKGLSLGVDHMMIYNAYNREASKQIEQKTIGEVNDVVTHMEFSFGATPEEAASWRCSNPKEIGGPIGDVASHCMYVAESVIGSRITSLQAVYLPKTMGIKVEEGALIYFHFENGLMGTSRVAFNQSRGGQISTLTNLGYEIYGSEGVIRGYGTLFQISGHSDEPIKVRLEVDKGFDSEEVVPEKINNMYQQIIGAHADSILNNNLFDGSDGIHNLALVLCAHQSAGKNGENIKIKD